MIVVEKLKKSFGDNEVLKDISMTINQQEVVVIIGPSGSGKSTFLRCINLLESISDGTIHINGKNITDKSTNINEVRKDVGMVFQQFNLFPHKSVLQNIMLSPMKVKKVSKENARIKALELLKKWA